jgi:DNA-binding MarR family transcriptional regulator
VVGEPTRAARASGATKPARKRAARGANREAVLAVIAAHPGASARELAAGSGVTGGTLYALLRKLTDEGEG